jgi:hypothetical protein
MRTTEPAEVAFGIGEHEFICLGLALAGLGSGSFVCRLNPHEFGP